MPGGVGADARPVGAPVGQGRLRLRGPGQVRPARPGHADRAAGLLRAGGAGARGALEPALDPAGGPRRLRDAAGGRHGRGLPGRVTGADGDAAPAAPGEVLRPGHRGGADPAGADPGRLGAPLHPAPARGGGIRPAARADAPGAGQDPRRPAVPGADDADRHRLRRVHPGRGGPAPPGHELQAGPGADRGAARPAAGRDGRPRDPGRHRRGHLRQDPRVLQLRVSRVARDQLRLPGLRQRLAQVLLPGRVHRRAAARPAHGLLRARQPDRRRPPPRRRGARRGRQRQRRAGHAGEARARATSR